MKKVHEQVHVLAFAFPLIYPRTRTYLLVSGHTREQVQVSIFAFPVELSTRIRALLFGVRTYRFVGL